MPDKNAHQVRGGRRSWSTYARILRQIHDGINNTVALAPLNMIRTENMRDILRRMTSLGLIHVSGSLQASNGVLSPRYAVGKGEPAVALNTNKPLKPGVELIALANMLRAMAVRGQTIKRLTETAGLSRQRVDEFIKVCHEELHMVYVARYERVRIKPGGSPAAAYAFGFDLPDAPRPKPMPTKLYNARCHARKVAKRRQRETLIALSAQSSVFRLAA
jgi:hypothetical protein